MSSSNMPVQWRNVNSEVSVSEGIERALKALEAATEELILLQSQCVGNNNDVLNSASSLVGSIAVFSTSLKRANEKLLKS